MTLTDDVEAGPLAAINRLLEATNKHDLEGLAGCFAPGYVNETPAHPLRGFTGRETVRSNWEQLFTGVPNITARMLAHSVTGDHVWAELHLSGSRRDGTAHDVTGVIVFRVEEGIISNARFYLEPVERTMESVDDAAERVTHRVTHGRPAAQPVT
ncbi:nuclear transport factor 2 family protein [Arthrobacter cavernae]|uniref:Nuclear transport factor 2 family protein n=1 Tax=Arthrobacter cavernae TaxID=2817681 RepID=A0A939HH25_9MICC|nr:nuclear transport factor 2 family protein [Arthrobacter cavernae]MBO1267847.1 nuclear transport factor 2 family protein [Arthrobacter cavernae]